MLLGLLTPSFSIASPIETFEAAAFVGDEVLTSREARGLVGEGRGDAEDMVDDCLVVESGLAGSGLQVSRMIVNVALMFESL